MKFHSPDDVILVRGVPIQAAEVYFQQERLGAQLFDESMFKNSLAKRLACANVIYELDNKLAESVIRKGPLGEEEIRTIDIDDPGWLYIPIQLVAPESNVVIMPTKDRPAGAVAWFRMKRFRNRTGVSLPQ